MRKISNKQSNLTPRATRKRKTKFPKVVKGKKYKDNIQPLHGSSQENRLKIRTSEPDLGQAPCLPRTNEWIGRGI